jgi:hypothetical protein
MGQEQLLRQGFTTIEVNDGYSEAVIHFRDQSSLFFCHRVGERWARAGNAPSAETQTTLAAEVLARISLFRLNAKHLDIQFTDGSRWEARFKKSWDRP